MRGKRDQPTSQTQAESLYRPLRERCTDISMLSVNVSLIDTPWIHPRGQ